MPQVCFYLQLHQPYRLRNFRVFDLGSGESYFSSPSGEKHNQDIFQKVAQKSYLPMLKLLKQLLDQQSGFCFALSCSGVFLEQAKKYQPEVLRLLQDLARSQRVEFLAETYFHSLVSLYSPQEFQFQVKKHTQLIQKLFNQTPTVFRNTELIYSNDIGQMVAKLGFRGMLTEAVDRYFGSDRKTRVLYSKGNLHLPLLLKHAQLSDDIAFRFSDKNWSWYPLSVEKYLDWVQIYGEKEIVNLFMDFETFGEHQWEDTGIFGFFATFVKKFLEKKWNRFQTPSQLFSQAETTAPAAIDDVYDVQEPISWADIDRSLTAWTDNVFQQDTLRVLYNLEKNILDSNDQKLIDDWRKLQTSDHFYYMCTKWAADGDVHAYFSPYESPHEAYRRYSIVLADLQERLL